MDCKYCDFENDVFDNDIWSDSFDFGILGRLDIEAYISYCNRKGEPVIDIQADVCDSNNASNDLGVKRIPVNFCPFCGRDLHKVDVKENLHDLYDLYQKDELATIIFNSLKRFGITYLEDLSFMTRRHASYIKGLGKKSMTYLDEVMKNYSVTYSTTDDLRIRTNLINVGDTIKYIENGVREIIGVVTYKSDTYNPSICSRIRLETETGEIHSIYTVREFMSIKIIKKGVGNV